MAKIIFSAEGSKMKALIEIQERKLLAVQKRLLNCFWGRMHLQGESDERTVTGKVAPGPPQREEEEKKYRLVRETGRLWNKGCWARKGRRAGSEGIVTLKWDKQIANCGKSRAR